MEPIEFLVGRKVKGFAFKGGPGCTPTMKTLVGKTGEIIAEYGDVCAVKFLGKSSWNYPYPEILDHLIEEEQTEEIMEKKEKYLDLIGKEFTTFKFQSTKQLTYFEDYDKVLGLTAVVERINDTWPEYAHTRITLENGRTQTKYYPSKMIKQQVEERENKSVDDIVNEMKHLISRI